eukprot:CAMPEP_0194080202 /NCGR_PEP_ID=MMETSP0149-20130528/6267_1 /TAXON_ID=122233 /ORGANISM="Chaetoceros debilis, Strain MM31A-1" /LENGTH=41 /DNA_ID= /DNA_START= /DNA_END= /DNA_ORIENTATION=
MTAVAATAPPTKLAKSNALCFIAKVVVEARAGAGALEGEGS